MSTASLYFRKLLSQSAIIFGMRVAGAGIMFLVQAAIARGFGSDSLGRYIQAIAALNLLAAILPLGFHTIAAYFAAQYGARGEGLRLRRFFRQALVQAAIMGTLGYVGGLILLSETSRLPEAIATNWHQIAIMALALSTTFVSASVLIALKKPVIGLAGDSILRPLAAAAACTLAFVTAATDAVATILWTMAVAGVAVALVYVLLAGREVHKIPAGPLSLEGEHGRWWRFALPWTIIAVATDYFFDLDVLLLSSQLAYGDLAVFGAVTRIFAIAAFGIGAIYAVSLPDFFEADARSDTGALRRRIMRTNATALLGSLILLAGVMLFGRLVLSLFGPGFEAGTWPLAILCLTLVVRSVFGPAALVLSLHDRPYASLPAVAAGVLLLVVGNHWLVPVWGLIGAAVSALLSITAWSLAMWFTAYRLTGVDVSLIPALRR